MIRFSCTYCGRKIRAKDPAGGKHASCPACGHALLVPGRVAASENASSTEAASASQERAERWEGKSNKEIARLLLRRRPVTKKIARLLLRRDPVTEEERTRAATRAALSPLLPRYDDLTLFALSATLLLLLVINPEIKTDLPRVMVLSHDGRIGILLGLAAAGMVFSLFGIFFRCPKPEFVKWPMLIFAVFVTAGTGAYAGYVTLKSAHGWLMVFPAWNTLNAALLLLLFRAGLLGADCVVDRAARFSQVVVTVIAISILLAVCQYLFHLHWAITYSVCVGYTMSLHHAIADVFGGADEIS